MPRPFAALPILKVLGLVVILGCALYGGHAWLNAGQDAHAPDAPSAPNDHSGVDPAAAGTAIMPRPGLGHQNAKDVAQAYASDRQAADARFKGRRMQIQGLVSGIESGQGQVMLITLGADDGHAGLRAVVDGRAQPLARQALVGQALSLDCLNQGLLMGEPVLSDCLVLP